VCPQGCCLSFVRCFRRASYRYRALSSASGPPLELLPGTPLQPIVETEGEESSSSDSSMGSSPEAFTGVLDQSMQVDDCAP
jgi:hypothetical protein